MTIIGLFLIWVAFGLITMTIAYCAGYEAGSRDQWGDR